MNTHELTGADHLACPTCKKILDGCSGDHVDPPVNGDLTVCLYCGELLCFQLQDGKYSFIPLTYDLREQIKKEAPAQYEQLMDYQFCIVQLMTEKNIP